MHHQTSPPSKLHLDLVVIQDENVTAITIDSPGFDGVVGTARRHPRDTHVPQLGVWLALQRLFEKLSRYYEEAVAENIHLAHSQPEQDQPMNVDVVENDEFMRQVWDALGVPESERA